MTRLLVYAGANGAGKSTLRDLADDPVEVEIDPDRIARAINPADPRSVDVEAGKEALRLFDTTLAARRSMSLETTLTGRTVLMRMRAAREAGFDVELRYVGLDGAGANAARVEARASRGGHWIAPDVIARRVERSFENLPAAVGLAHRSLLVDNTGRSHRRVFECERGRILYRAPDPPRWLAERVPLVEAALRDVIA